MKVSNFALKNEILVCKNILLSFFQKMFGFRKILIFTLIGYIYINKYNIYYSCGLYIIHAIYHFDLFIKIQYYINKILYQQGNTLKYKKI